MTEEQLVLDEAVRRVELGEEERGAEQIDVVTAACECSGEAAVVRNGVADGVG